MTQEEAKKKYDELFATEADKAAAFDEIARRFQARQVIIALQLVPQSVAFIIVALFIVLDLLYAYIVAKGNLIYECADCKRQKTPRLHFCNRGVVLDIKPYLNVAPVIHPALG